MGTDHVHATDHVLPRILVVDFNGLVFPFLFLRTGSQARQKRQEEKTYQSDPVHRMHHLDIELQI